MDGNWMPIKPMHERRWAIGVWTYQGYLGKMVDFGTNRIAEEDFVFITGDIVHDMKAPETENSIRWLRQHIHGTIVICRGNHDKFWQPGTMRQKVSDLPNLYILDEGEIITIGPYTIGCFSNHSTKTQDFSFVDGRYLETAINTVKQAVFKNTIPVMMSHYPVNLAAAKAIGKAGVKAYMSGHIHCTDANNSPTGDGLNWDWYSQSAAQTDDLNIEGCYYSTGTTDVVLARCKQSFKEIKVLEVEDKDKKVDPPDEMLILCGLPGSGKSTIANVFRDRYEYVRVNQDDLGSKRMCVKVLEAALKNGKSVVIDRCNFDSSQRKTWIDLARFHKVKKIRAVELELSVEESINRAGERENHPTINGRFAAENVIKALAPLYVSPQLSEGLSEIVRVSTNALTPRLDVIIDMIQNPEKHK
jgi:predicted phosphohydrolase/gluconate kinase